MSFQNFMAMAEAPALGFDTAVLILAVVGLVLLAKVVLDLKNEVAALKRGTSVPVAPPLAAPPVPAASVPASPAAPAEIPAHVRAAIAAAIHVTHGPTHRIVSVTPVQSLLWSREGRRQVFDSHRVR